MGKVMHKPDLATPAGIGKAEDIRCPGCGISQNTAHLLLTYNVWGLETGSECG